MNIELNGAWRMESKKLFGLSAEFPGSVLSTLLSHQIIADPYYRQNEAVAREYLYDDYTFTRNFPLTKQQLSNTNYLLLRGVHTVADVYINQVLVAKCCDMHLDQRIRLDPTLLRECNEIRLEFFSSYRYIDEYDDQRKFETFAVTRAKGPCLRQPHFMFGWDWAPDLSDMGVFGGISILSTSLGYLDEFRHEVNFLPDGSARIDVQVAVESLGSGTLEATLSLPQDGTLLQWSSPLPLRESSFSFRLPEPKRWYPIGYGDPTLYDLTFRLSAPNGEVQTETYRIGLREVTIDDRPDQWGTNFSVSINSVPIFLKGAAYVPEDSILSRITPERSAKLMKLATDFSHNCIRVWGGGYYPTDALYDYCDEHGILIWQDLMFACAAYNMDDKHFRDLIVAETIQNVKRFRHHASVFLIAGDNECEDGVNGHEPQLMEAYRVMSLEVLCPLMETLTSTYFLRTSPRSAVMYCRPNDLDHFDTHYWRVWCDEGSLSTYGKIYPRMLSEVGSFCFATMNDIRSFAEKDDMAVDSPVMLDHQKYPNGNRRIMLYVNAIYGKPKTFEHAVLLSQHFNAESMRLCCEHMRSNRERCNGMLYWQLNDCWPNLSCSSIDYGMALKPLHYFSGRFFAPHLICADLGEDGLMLCASNDTPQDMTYRLAYRHETFTGEVLEEASVTALVKAGGSSRVLPLPQPRSDTVLHMTLFAPDGSILCDNFYQETIDREVSYPAAQITVRQINDTTVSVSTDVFAKYICIDCPDATTVLSDNYFTLAGGQTKLVTADRPICAASLKITTLEQMITFEEDRK